MTKLRFTTLCVIFCSAVFAISLAGCGKVSNNTGSAPADLPTAAAPSAGPITEERVYYNFEKGPNGWEIPLWASSKEDYVAKGVEVSQDFASSGSSSLKLTADFPGEKWTAALTEIQQYLDISSYRVIMADLYIPESVPMGLKADIILTVGETWKFVEMSRNIPLVPGEWVTITANIEPGSYDWKRVVPDEAFAGDVRKIAVRVISNQKPVYSGAIYIDNIRAGR